MTKLTAMEPTSMPTEQHTLVSGTKINSMVKELKSGQMVQSTRATTSMARNMVRANSLLLMGPPIPANSKTTKFLDRENMFGLMVKCTMGNGRKIRCMARVCSYGETGRGTKANSSTTNAKAAVLSSGKMAGGTRATGAKASNTEWAYLPAKIIKLKGASGNMVGKSGG